MVKLEVRAPKWVDVLPGVRIKFAPISPKAWRAAKRAASSVFADGIDEDIDEAEGDAGDALSRKLIERGILEWDGVGDADGNPVEPTPDRVEKDDNGDDVLDADGNPVIIKGTVSLFLDDPFRFDAVDRAYVLPYVLEQREGNVSAGSPNGISAGATPATDTANSAAQPTPAGGVKRAHTGKTSSKRTKATTPGK